MNAMKKQLIDYKLGKIKKFEFANILSTFFFT